MPPQKNRAKFTIIGLFCGITVLLVSVVALLASIYQSRRKHPRRSVGICKSIWIFFIVIQIVSTARVNCNLIFSNRFSIIGFRSLVVLSLKSQQSTGQNLKDSCKFHWTGSPNKMQRIINNSINYFRSHRPITLRDGFTHVSRRHSIGWRRCPKGLLAWCWTRNRYVSCRTRFFL